MKVPLLGAAYTARNIIANAQRSVNLYGEKNPEDSPFPTTYYQTPGIELVAVAPVNVDPGQGWRGLYTATNGWMFGVCGDTLYRISPIFQMQVVCTISTDVGPVSMVDNGVSLLLVDGTPDGWVVDIETSAFTRLSEADNFYGGDRVDLMDGFFILNRPSSNQFYLSGFQSATFDPLDFATKTGFSDDVAAVGVTKRVLYVFGTQTTEIWQNTGGSAFPLSRMSGPFIQYGCASPASVVQMDGSLFWLSSSPLGECLVLQTQNYDRSRISTFAIEKEFQGYPTVADATGYAYQEEGHSFYVLNFPTANKTWAYDIATNEWHERTFMNKQGVENRQRQCCHALMGNQNIVGDWENGNLYRMSSALFTDGGFPIHRIRSFPHMVGDGHRVMYRSFTADMQVGEGVVVGGEGSEVRLRFSDTRGSSWGTHLAGTLGARGNYLASIQYLRLGMARDRVFELSWSSNCQTALNGAFVDLEVAGS